MPNMPIWKTAWQFDRRLTQEYHIDPTIPLLGIWNCKHIHRKTGTWLLNSNIIHSEQKASTTQIVTYWWTKQQCNGILLSKERKLSADEHDNIDEPWKHYAWWKKSVTKATYCMSPFMNDMVRIGKSTETQSTGGCQRLEGGGVRSDC